MSKFLNYFTIVITTLFCIGLSNCYATIVTDSSGDSVTDSSNDFVTDTSGPSLMAPSITTQPASATVTAPATETFTLVATGYPAPTYQWKQEAPGAGSFTAISGATSASYTTPATTVAYNGTQYECVVTNGLGSVTSSAVTLTVDAAPIITTQPTGASVTAPATATFTLAATGYPTPTYQWQQEAPGGSSYTTISGATSASYTTPATTTADNGTNYECVVTNSVSNVTSNAVTLTVNAPPPAPTLNTATPGDSNVVLNWTAVTGATSYVVQFGTVSGVYDAVSTGNVTNFTVTGLINGTTYYFVVAGVDSYGTGPNSNVLSAVPAPSALALTFTYDDLNRMTNGQSAAPTNTAYSYDEVGNILSQDTAVVSGTTISLDTTAPSAPTSLSASAISSHQVNLTWTASTDDSGVFGYIVYRNGYKLATTTLTSYSDLDLVTSTMYSYYVIATDAAGNLSGASSTATLTTP